MADANFSLALVGVTVAVALAFDLVNGVHDAANSIATIVSTRVLSPRWAVLWAAFFNFVAMFFFNVPFPLIIIVTGLSGYLAGKREAAAVDLVGNGRVGGADILRRQQQPVKVVHIAEILNWKS